MTNIPNADAIRNFPAELKALPQWCVATLAPKDDGKEDKRPFDPKTGKAASSTNPATWGTFDQAVELARKWQSTNHPRAAIGFVFADSDPYAVIDLDTYKAQSDMTRKLHVEIARYAETYSELSQSGLGTHIIGRGHVAEGSNNAANALEVYSSGRFMICTGRVVGGQAKPVAIIQDLLDHLYPLLKHGGSKAATSWQDLGEGEDSGLTDAEVIERAWRRPFGRRRRADPVPVLLLD